MYGTSVAVEIAAGEDSSEATGEATHEATGEATCKAAAVEGEAGEGDAGGIDSRIAGSAAVVLARRSANRNGQAFDLM